MTSDEHGKNWAAYYAATADRPPRRTLLEALARFAPTASPRFAVDLGCGDGRDTIELLRRGWSVLAIDAESAAIERLQRRPDLPEGAHLTCLCQRFEDATWPEADLVYASFSLPLCPPDRFPDLWRRIAASLKPGGRFSGQLFGDRDGWVGRPGMTHMSRAAAGRLFKNFRVEFFEEEETDSVTPRGKPKHWHIFYVVAERP
jgi:SAM-dependent methyltransferase